MTKQELAQKALPWLKLMAEGKTVMRRGTEIKSLEELEDNIRCYHELHVGEPPKFRPWASVEEMGEKVDWWFRMKVNKSFIFKIRQIDTCEITWDDMESSTFAMLFANNECSPTPWIADSWQPCGVVK